MTAAFQVSLLTSVMCLGLTGCYPALRTVQPRAQFVVQDISRSPIEGATVTLGTRRMWGGAETQTAFRTDAAGKVSLRSTHQWEWQIMLPDGTSWYEWTWCIEKPGYRAIAELKPDFRKTVVVTLERSEKRSVCVWPSDTASLHVMED